MFTTCLFCNGSLGRNEIVEVFPVGRRLAFDADRGRLWVVCRKCERWNLSPLEERWEAIEECERLFSSTRLRMSTDNVGLARLREGLELVRIGRPQRPELAAWRYGDQFGRRRRNYMLAIGGGVVAGTALVVAGPVTGLLAGGTVNAINLSVQFFNLYRGLRAGVTAVGPDGALIEVPRNMLGRVRVAHDAESSSWTLELPQRREKQAKFWPNGTHGLTVPDYYVTLRGEEALRAAGQLLPKFNAAGASKQAVAEAVSIVEEAGDPTSCFTRVAREATGRRRYAPLWSNHESPGAIREMKAPMRLALEMAAHEETERRALEGELGVLEEAWRQAEEIASIADNLLVPASVTDEIVRRRAGSGA